jgi:hypothetical protein
MRLACSCRPREKAALEKGKSELVPYNKTVTGMQNFRMLVYLPLENPLQNLLLLC